MQQWSQEMMFSLGLCFRTEEFSGSVNNIDGSDWFLSPIQLGCKTSVQDELQVRDLIVLARAPKQMKCKTELRNERKRKKTWSRHLKRNEKDIGTNCM